MGLWNRFLALLGMKASKAMSRAENPAETLDYSYEQMQTLLQNFRRSLADVATSKALVERQLEQAQANVEKLDGQARDAVASGRDDLAKQVLQRKIVAQQQVASISRSVTDLQAKQDHLVQQEAEIKLRIESFRSEKEVIKANYTAAQAQVKVHESITGLSDSAYSAGAAIGRIKDRTDELEARAAAINELSAADVFTDYTGDDRLTRELDQVAASGQVEAELAALKGEVGSGDDRAALAAGATEK